MVYKALWEVSNAMGGLFAVRRWAFQYAFRGGGWQGFVGGGLATRICSVLRAGLGGLRRIVWEDEGLSSARQGGRVPNVGEWGATRLCKQGVDDGDLQHFEGGVRRFPTHGTREWERLSSAQQEEGGKVLPMGRRDLQRFEG